ncbi:Uncharacterised protein [Porphyromonas macacae]|uniref:Uncharacterized protein n=1 Tax=Porphyromonas macacae TaxID=28115 RepID=A0A379EAX8_9PORP|nr:Uncharacterised protein [Porphyromonas macacae]
MSKFIFGTAPVRCIGMRRVQGVKTEAERSIFKYVTEAECRNEHSHLHMMTRRLFSMILYSDVFVEEEEVPKMKLSNLLLGSSFRHKKAETATDITMAANSIRA